MSMSMPKPISTSAPVAAKPQLAPATEAQPEAPLVSYTIVEVPRGGGWQLTEVTTQAGRVLSTRKMDAPNIRMICVAKLRDILVRK